MGIPLEHLRGMRLSVHQFVKVLCRDEYGIPFTQLAPNLFKWINWFFGCCHMKDYIPTFKLFHHLFKIKKSANFPLFELQFKKDECGFPPKATIPVVMQNSLRGWNQEFIFFRGGDLEFMLLYSDSLKKENFSVQKVGCETLTKIYDFCGEVGRQWTRDSFLDNSTLYAIGCKYGFG